MPAAVRAETMNWVADGAPRTTLLAASRTKPSPLRAALASTWPRSCRARRSPWAKASKVSPSMMPGSSPARCSAVAASFSRLPQRMTVGRKGSTTRPFPKASITTIVSTPSPPMPPSSSAKGRASRPSSAKVRQWSRLRPSSDATILRRASKAYSSWTNRSMESRRSCCCSESPKSMDQALRRILETMFFWISFDPP